MSDLLTVSVDIMTPEPSKTRSTRKKRGPGEGSIFKLKDSRYRGQLLVGYDEKGRARHKVFEGKTRAEVQRRLTEALANQHKGLNIAPERMTLGVYLERWLAECVRPRVRPSTYRSYSGLVKDHIIPKLGSTALTKLTPIQLQAFLNEQQVAGNAARKGGVSARTVHYILTVLRNALDQAVRWDLVPRNVAQLVDPPRTPHFEVTPLTPEQARSLLEVAQSHRLGALYSVAVALGLRQGEALALRWTDVDFERGMITVRHTLQRIEKKFCLVEPKTKQSRRTVALPDVVKHALVQHRERQEMERAFAGEDWANDWDLVFTTLMGTPIDQSNLLRQFAALKKLAKLPATLRFHDLRHTCASLLIAQGVHPRQIMGVLGHSAIGLTMNHYGHLYAAMAGEAAAKMDAILQAPTPKPGNVSSETVQ